MIYILKDNFVLHRIAVNLSAHYPGLQQLETGALGQDVVPPQSNQKRQPVVTILQNGVTAKAENKQCWTHCEKGCTCLFLMSGRSEAYVLGNAIRTTKFSTFNVFHLSESKSSIDTSIINSENVCSFNKNRNI